MTTPSEGTGPDDAVAPLLESAPHRGSAPPQQGAPHRGSAPLRVGYLHVGRDRSGVRRYGSILATEVATRDDIEVIESDVGGRDASWSDLRVAARRLSKADVVHLQWKLADWNPRLGGIPRMEVALQVLPRPVVITLHDVFGRSGLRERWLSPSALGMRRLGGAAARLVVHADVERQRLEGMVPAAKVAVVPHFVETRSDLPEREAARVDLDVAGRRVVTLLGAMTKRRGHRLVIDALTRLPEDLLALFVGAPIEGRDHVGKALAEHAADVGVGDRVRFMGYVSDERLAQVLSATDVGLCPFREMSASGALATWISAGRPIVVSDLPAMGELDALEPGALRTFAPYEADALAARISDTLDEADGRPDTRVTALAQRLATPTIVDRYVDIYRAALSQT